jgi:hypothetical protein
MILNSEQNATFMNDPRRVGAEQELHKIVEGIRAKLQFPGTAQYYVTVLPPRLKELEKAIENLNTIEATIEAEILGKEHWHG